MSIPINPEENEEFDLLDLAQIEGLPPDNPHQHSNCLVGKLHSAKSVNSYALLEVMKKAWKSKHGIEAREWSHNLFLFRFKDAKEVKWVINNQPWHFEGELFLIRPLEGNEQPSTLQILEAQLWVRVYDAPVSCMNPNVASALAKKLGALVTLDQSLDLFGKFLRMKINVDISKPLKRGMSVLVGGVKLWLPIKYEGLPIFCYNCGMIGHTLKLCDAIDHSEEPVFENLPFGPSIKASPLKSSRYGTPALLPQKPYHKNQLYPHPTIIPLSDTRPGPAAIARNLSSQVTKYVPPNKRLTNKVESPPSLGELMDICETTPEMKLCQSSSSPRPTPLSNSQQISSNPTSPAKTLTCEKDSTLTPTYLLPTPPKNKNKKAWKKLARGKALISQSHEAAIQREKRPLPSELSLSQEDFTEAKRLKVLSISPPTESTAEAAPKQLRRSS